LLPSAARDHPASLARRGALVKTRDLADACAVVNRIAPEHLELAVCRSRGLLPQIRHAGAIFVVTMRRRRWATTAGPNHVLPTGRTARFSSPLGVYDFEKRSSVLRLSRAAAQTLGPVAATLARGEGLIAHARSAEARFTNE
jgi:histidinol dehydrogenase